MVVVTADVREDNTYRQEATKHFGWSRLDEGKGHPPGPKQPPRAKPCPRWRAAKAGLELNNRVSWLLLAGAEVVGYLAAGANTLPHAEAREGDIELKRLYILAAHQNGGHGARLMDAFIAWLDQPQRRALWVGVWEENFAAQRFYARYGCEKVGEYDFIVGSTRDREFILRRR